MRFTFLIVLYTIFTATISGNDARLNPSDTVIANGQMPQLATDHANNIHMVYGRGDSILYISSANRGATFSPPELVAVLPGLFAHSMRGPQVAASANGVTITANTQYGNIYSFHKEAGGKWSKAVQVNKEDSTSREALMGLSADGTNTYAVWLGAKKPQGQNVYGSRSADGGKTLSKNVLVYASPDHTVCECCKPSVVVQDNQVYVMFRNWLQGNRDMYVIRSADAGKTFGQLQKLGTGNWKLNGCPMDGGGLAVDKNGTVETVWRREGKMYACQPDTPEKEIGGGRGCTVEIFRAKPVYAWIEKGEVVLADQQGKRKVLGKGSLPLVRSLDNEQLICVWENENQIHASVTKL